MIISKRPPWRASLAFNIIGTKTEPEKLLRMFQSIEAIADQIVVIADEKADKAFFDIARRYTPDIFFYRWEDDFALARNRALLYTRADYVAWIDTDEYYEPAVASRIYSLMERPLNKCYYVWQVSRQAAGQIIFVPQLRIFPLKRGVVWEIPIHEQILPSLRRLGVRTELTDLRVVHSGYYAPEMVKAKHRRNLPILQRRLRDEPGDWFTRSNYEKAIQYERTMRRSA